MKSAFLAALLAIPLILTGCSDQPGSPAADKKAEPLQVETIRPVMETSAPREFPGSVAASRLLPMASRLPAYIRSVPHQEGDLVKRGDVVAVLDDSDVRSIREQAYADVKAASIRLRDAETDVQKFEGLYRDEAASEIELRKVKLLRDQTAETLRAARARLTQANERLGDAVIRAPEPARVLSIQLQPGTLAVPGLPIVTLESLDGQVFEIHLPAELLGSVKPGDPAAVTLDGRTDPIKGTVTQAVHSADPVTRTGVVKIALPKGDRILTGTFGRAAIAGNASEKGIFIPKSAITNRGGLDGCFVIRDGHAEFHWLRLGTTLPDGSRKADAGLKGDEILVKSPPSSLTDGAPVKAIPDPAAAAGAAP